MIKFELRIIWIDICDYLLEPFGLSKILKKQQLGGLYGSQLYHEGLFVEDGFYCLYQCPVVPKRHRVLYVPQRR